MSNSNNTVAVMQSEARVAAKPDLKLGVHVISEGVARYPFSSMVRYPFSSMMLNAKTAETLFAVR